MNNLLSAGTLAAIAALSLAACSSGGGSTTPIVPTSGAAPVATATAKPTATPAPIATPTAAPTPTATPTASPTATPAPTPTPTPAVLTTADQAVQPTLICIGHRPWDGRYYLRFGYNSTEAYPVEIAIDSMDGSTQLNQVIVTPADGTTPFEFTAQPTYFAMGSNTAFDVAVNQKDHVTWNLDGNSLTATTNGAVQCP